MKHSNTLQEKSLFPQRLTKKKMSNHRSRQWQNIIFNTEDQKLWWNGKILEPLWLKPVATLTVLQTSSASLREPEWYRTPSVKALSKRLVTAYWTRSFPNSTEKTRCCSAKSMLTVKLWASTSVMTLLVIQISNLVQRTIWEKRWPNWC